MSAEDHGIAAAVGAALAGAVGALASLRDRRRKKRLRDAGPAPEPSAMSVRVGLLASRVDQIEHEVRMLKHTIDTKFDRLSESVDELGKASSRTNALVEQLQERLGELRADLRDERRGTRG